MKNLNNLSNEKLHRKNNKFKEQFNNEKRIISNSNLLKISWGEI